MYPYFVLCILMKTYPNCISYYCEDSSADFISFIRIYKKIYSLNIILIIKWLIILSIVTHLTPPQFRGACSKIGSGIPITLFYVLKCLRSLLVVCFIDIGIFVDNHCLNCPLIYIYYVIHILWNIIVLYQFSIFHV